MKTLFWRSGAVRVAQLPRFDFSILFEPRDLWVGLFWDHPDGDEWRLYLCLVPMLVLKLVLR